ncbi:MAG: DUF3037 domain-containing protein [Ktedonobacteraceae bacterium]
MPDRSSYDYAIIRVVPRVERGECINVGVILFCRTRNFLGVLIHVDEARLLALASDLDLEMIHGQLEMFTLTCAGKVETGSIGLMSPSERFHWLVSPRSTSIQTSPVHCGLSCDPETTLQHLLHCMVYTSKQV